MQDSPEHPGNGPLYLRLRDTLAQRIGDGTHQVGDLLPTEMELARMFSTSRFTVREALRALQDQGMIERRQGVGTRVISRQPTQGYSLSAASLEDLFQIGAGTCYVLLDHGPVVLDDALSETTGGSPGEAWHRADAMRWTAPGGRPICFVQSWFPARYAPLTDRFETHDGPLFGLLEAHADGPVQEAVQEISARIMPDRIARMLGQRPGTPALVLLRRYVTQAGVLIASVNWHPAEQMTYVTRILRRSGPVSVDLS